LANYFILNLDALSNITKRTFQILSFN